MFCIFGVLGIALNLGGLHNYWPLLILYATLLWNDYFSIQHFSKIIPAHRTSQRIIDWSLVVLHFLLAISFGVPFNFTIVMTVLFVVATFKYSRDRVASENLPLLYRKIKMDALGAAFSAVTIIGVAIGFVRTTTIIWAVLFAGTTIYLMYIDPLYRE
jgi:hypothetical protein